MVGHLTAGLSGPETGRGAMRRALAWRALRLQTANKKAIKHTKTSE